MARSRRATSQEPTRRSMTPARSEGRVTTRQRTRERSLEATTMNDASKLLSTQKRLSILPENVDVEGEEEVEDHEAKGDEAADQDIMVADAEDENALDHSLAFSGTTANSASEIDPQVMRMQLGVIFENAKSILQFIFHHSRTTEMLSNPDWQLDPKATAVRTALASLSGSLTASLKPFTAEEFIDPRMATRKMLENNNVTVPKNRQLDDILLKVNLARFVHVLLEEDRELMHHLLTTLNNSFPLPLATGFDQPHSITPGATSLTDEMLTFVLDMKTQFALTDLAQSNLDAEGIIGPQFFEPFSSETQEWDLEALLEEGKVKSLGRIDKSLRRKYLTQTRERVQLILENLDPDAEDYELLRTAFPWGEFLSRTLQFIRQRDAELNEKIRAQGGANQIIDGFRNLVELPSDHEEEDALGQYHDEAEEALDQSHNDELETHDHFHDDRERNRLAGHDSSPPRQESSSGGIQASDSPSKNQRDRTSTGRSNAVDDFALRVAQVSTQLSRPSDSGKENHLRRFNERQPGASRVQFDESQIEQTQAPEEDLPRSRSALGKRPASEREGFSDDDEYQVDARQADLNQRRRATGVESYGALASRSEPQPRRASPAAPLSRSRPNVPSSQRPLLDNPEPTPRGRSEQGGPARPSAVTPAPMPARVRPGKRLPWSREEDDQLIRMVGKHGPRWANIKREDARSDDIFVNRNDGALKDRARILRVQMERSAEGPAPGFEQVTLRAKEIQSLNELWKGRKVFEY